MISSPAGTAGEDAADRTASVVVARNAFGLSDALILDRGLEHHALRQLVHHAALDFLPWRLAFRDLVSALSLERRHALRILVLTDQNVRGTLVEIDAHAIASL